MNIVLINFIQIISQVLSLLLIVDILLSYFMSPYHPIRATIDRIIQPLLNPIRRIVPPIAMIDFSPLVLLILIQLVANLLISILARS
ncbi:MAG TPA: YggT family protein [Anaerolineaceae bacterium]|nr:YggT family protein [Anaerolineaceae bacterium]